MNRRSSRDRELSREDGVPGDGSAGHDDRLLHDDSALREADAQARREAQTIFDEPFVLEAGAGTGKTTALVARIVGWVMGPGWDEAARDLLEDRLESPEDDEIALRVLDGVVAITFTEAAAAEMESGVGRVLSLIFRDEPPGFILSSNLPEHAGERRHRAEILLSNLDRLQARTIHGWCSRILNRFPLEAGLHPLLQVDADGSLRRDIAEEVVEEHLHSAYTQSVDPALLHLARDGKGPGDLADTLIRLVEKGLRAEDLQPPFSPRRLRHFQERLVECFQRVDPEISSALRHIKGKNNAPRFAEWIDHVRELLHLSELTTTSDLETFLTAVLDNNIDGAEKRLKEWKKGEFNKGEEKVLSNDQKELLREAAPDLLSAVASFQSLRPEELVSAFAVLRPLLAQVQKRLHARGILGYEDLLRKTRDLLRDRASVRELLRREIDQLLVDEFQDTNSLQCEIISLLARQGPKHQRPGLFLVGDPKQSIYGWRGADLAAYDRFVREIEATGPKRRRLSVNFRSVPEILDEVARTVKPVMHEHIELQPPFQALLPCEKNAGEEGYRLGSHRSVEHWVSRLKLEAEGPEGNTLSLDPGSSVELARLESDRLASDLLRLAAEGGSEFKWSSIGLLFRATGDLEIYLARLRRAGIPYAVQHDRLYFQRREIIDAMALTASVLQPENQLALLTFLRSPWVGVPNAALLGLWWRAFAHEMTRLRSIDQALLKRLHATVDETAAEISAEATGIGRIEAWERNLHLSIEQLAALRATFIETSPAALVHRMRRWTLCEAREAARYLGPYRAANLERFFRRLRAELSDPNRNPREILRRLQRGIDENAEEEEAKLQEGSRDAVRVMTIHKAKGLDFEHVYLLQTHKEAQGRRGKDQTEILFTDEGVELQVLGYPTLELLQAKTRIKSVLDHERVRLLYVALTRAKRRLVMAGGRHLPASNRDEDTLPARAKSFSDLLGPRTSKVQLEQKALECIAKGDDSFVEFPSEIESPSEMESPSEVESPPEKDAADAVEEPPRKPEVLWRFLAAEENGEANREPAPPKAQLVALDRALTEARRLAMLREEAARRRARPYHRSPSAGGHDEPRPSDYAYGEEDEEGEGNDRASGGKTRGEKSAKPQGQPGGRQRDVAMLAGSAIHAALEHYDLSLSREKAWEQAVLQAEAELDRLAQGSFPGSRAKALDHLREILGDLEESQLIGRLRQLDGFILGREVGLLTAPLGEIDLRPVGFHPGSIDLLYLDPETGAVVVADYKTDAVHGEQKLAARAETYRHQGAIYRATVQEALRLPSLPRFELWFLRADQIVDLP